jgi:hypothetical protein
MTWLFEDKEVTELPDDCVGYVYCITNLTNNKKYIGKKLAKFSKTTYKTIKLKNGKKKKKRIKKLIDSDWVQYYGSNKELLKDIKSLGQENFKREILYYCKSKSECSYVETREQFLRGVLESNDYYNGIINCRINGNHIMGKLSS